jgi:hypothetical protein
VARVAHDHRTSLRAWWLRKAYYGTGAAPLALRHTGAVPPLVLSPWSAAVSALLLTGRSRAVVAALGVSAVAAERLARSLGARPVRAVLGGAPAAGGPGLLGAAAARPARAPTPPGPGAPPAGAAPRRGVRRPRATAALLVGLGASGAVSQTTSAVTRHHWPVAALSCLVSRRARRVVAAIALAEGVADWWRRDRRPRSLPGHVLARRLDDLAYGAGLWWGALRLRTVAPLLPAWSRTRFAGGGAGNPRSATVERGHR